MSGAATWQLRSITVRDFLGIQGEKLLSFAPGKQVVYAGNHTGKTSVTMALLWGLTGVIPGLARIDKKSFRLTNRHAGDNAETGVTVELVNAAGQVLRITRTYQVRQKWDEDLTVESDDGVFAGEEAMQIIEQELGVKPDSLEGCGVVLQDHRLKLITGKTSEISDVINDMLGLYTLSELVPTVETVRKEADQLRKNVDAYLDAADPLQRWEEREKELSAAYDAQEDACIASGFSAERLEQPEALCREELAAVGKELDAPAFEASAPLASVVQQLREHLSNLRASSPAARQLTALGSRQSALEKRTRQLEKLLAAYAKEDQQLIAASAEGEMDQSVLRKDAAEAEATLSRVKERLSEIKDEQTFLAAAYEHLVAHPEGEVCPLCDQAVDRDLVTEHTRARMEDQLAAEIDALKREERTGRQRKKDSEARLKVLQALQSNHAAQVDELQHWIDSASEPAWQLPGDAEDLFLDSEHRAALLRSGAEVVTRLRKELTGIEQEIAKEQAALEAIETETYQPADQRITRCSEKLLPLIEALQRIEQHGRTRETAKERKETLARVQKQAKEFAGRLRKIMKSMAEEEEAAASEAVTGRLAGISETFKAIADNPYYDGLDVRTKIARDKVSYDVEATSSRIGNLNHAVGHVLSEGDLSAAGMALLLGLASGDSHRMGFMVLDDPAQGMDESLQANFAAVLGARERPPQLVVLTHQRAFADSLDQAGVARQEWTDWMEQPDG